jgi:hypothetical protein
MAALPRREEIRAQLANLVERYRAARRKAEQDTGLQQRIGALAHYQSRRLATTYADLRSRTRYRAAVDFFLRDLYGPHDLTTRDEQILRAMDKLQKFLPAGALTALAHAFELHVLTIELDSDTAVALPAADAVDATTYARAYKAADRAPDREHQIALVGEIGQLLDSLAHRPEVGLAVRLARGPAHAAGYGELQDFLERGYDAFRAMNGAQEFLDTIDERERALMHTLLQ